MLSNGIRELAYIVKIDAIHPIEGADRVEVSQVGGWKIMTRRGQFKPGDYAIYFEIDSKVPEVEPFMFLEPKHFEIKSQKYFRGQVISQGLLMGIEDFTSLDNPPAWALSLEARVKEGKDILNEGLTEAIGVTYAKEEDNKRKAPSEDKYKKMAQRRPNIFKKPWARWMMKRQWGRKVMFFFFGKKKDKKGGWPQWVKKTDEERVQNMPWLFPGDPNKRWIATEKIDGTSTTFTMRGRGRKRQFLVCSRNVVFDKPDKKCFYETNVYTEMEKKYNMEAVLTVLMDKIYPKADFVTIQGETYGAGIQKRDYGLKDHAFAAFNLIISEPDIGVHRYNPIDMKIVLDPLDVPCVPIVDTDFRIPDTCDEILSIAEGSSKIDNGPREGLVFRTTDGVESFKAVSNTFLLKYHQ